MEDWSVDEWLKRVGMGRYVQAFLDNGYDTPELCGGLKDEDLDAIGVTSKQHRSKLFAQAKILHDLQSTASQANGSCNNNNTPLLATSPSQSPTYSEPWTGRGVRHNGVVAHGAEAADSHSAINRKPSGEKPPTKPKRQAQKLRHAPVSPSLPPAPYPRGEGAPKLTKLQLKLKIRDELQKDGIILSNAPYCKEDNQLGESELMDLAESYSQKFRIDSLGVYDALFKLWQHSTSEFVPSIREPATTQGGAMVDPSSNYVEPFDTQNEQTGKPLARVSSHETPSHLLGKPQLTPKSRTLPPAVSQSKTYEEPFDAVSLPAQSNAKHQKPKSPKSPLKQQATPPHVPVKQSASSGSSPDERSKHRHSADGGSQKSPSSLSPHSSPKHSRFKLFRKKTSHRPEKKSNRKKDERKYGSADDLTEIGNPFPSGQSTRTSVPIITLGGKPGTPPLPAGSGDSTTSESDDSPYPRKKHFGAKHAHFLPTHHIKPKDEEISSGESSSEQNKRLPTPQLRKLVTASDLELHKINPDAEDKRQSLRLSQSHEELRNAGVTFADPPDKEEKQAKKQGLISWIFKRRSLTPILRRKLKDKGNRDSTVSESALMVSSKSMPEIALAGGVRRSVNALDNVKDTPTFASVGYPEVFDSIKPHGQDFKPPKPARQRKLQPSPLLSPDEPLPVQKRMVIQSVPSMSPTDLVVIPIHSGSAPEGTSCLKNGSLPSGGPSPEPDEQKIFDSEYSRSEKSVSFKESPRIAWGPKSIHSQTESKSPVPIPDSHSPTPLQGDNEQGPPPTGEISLLRSSSGSSTGSASSKRPAPPPKPRDLSAKSRPAPLHKDVRKPFESHSDERERETEVSSPDATASKNPPPKNPPPKPSRSRNRTLKIEAVKQSQVESANKSKTLGSRAQSNDNFDLVSPPVKPLRLFERGESEGSLRTTHTASGRLGTASLPETPEGLRKPKPLPKPRSLAPVSALRTEDDTAAPLSLETQLCDKLYKEDIDLTQIPYSSMWGNYGIPTPLISRYASELGHSPTEIAHTLDTIRGKKLKELSREYAAAEESDFQKQTKIDTDNIEGFLTSIGLPMYSQVFRQKGYVVVQQISEVGNAGLDELGVKSEHSKILAQYLPRY